MQRIGDHEVREVLGRGAAGIVYRASSPRLGRDVAVKVVPWSTGSDAQRKRFTREADALVRIRHANVIVVHEVGYISSGAFLVMDLVPGRSLEELLSRDGPLPVARVIEVGAALARALDAVHQAGLIHRDVKPGNVLIREDGVPLLCDFGLVRDADPATRGSLTRTGVYVGTPSFWPPEQAMGDLARVGPRSDVYSLGATIHACLTGEPPLQAASVFDALDAALNVMPAPASRRRAELAPSADPVPAALDALVLRCLAKDPDDRPASALDVAAALEALAPARASRGRRAARGDRERAGAGAGRGGIPARVVGAAVAVAALLLVAALVWRGGAHPPGASDPEVAGPPTTALADPPRPTATTTPPPPPPPPHPTTTTAATTPRPDPPPRPRPVDPPPARPDTAGAALERARALSAAGDFVAAVDAYGEALAGRADLAATWFERARAWVGVANRLREPNPGTDVEQYLAAATRDLDEALRLDPRHADAAFTRAQVRRQRGGDLLLVKADLDLALACGVQGPLPLTVRGELRMELGEVDGAIEDLTRALDVAPDFARARARRGQARVRRGDLEAAFADLDAAVGAGERTAWALANRGLSRLSRTDAASVELALADLDDAAGLDPKDPWIGMNQAVLRAQTDPAGALAALDRVIEGADPSAPDIAAALATRGALRSNSGHPREALPDFDAALRARPDDIDALLNRGITRRKLDMAAEALADFDAAVRLAPTNPGALFERASSRAAMNDVPGATADLRAFLRVVPAGDPRTAHARQWLAERGLAE